MIIVEPAGARFEVSDAGLSTDEHLLERISSAENRIGRLTERLEKSLDLLLRQAQNSYFDRSLVKALIDLLSDDGLIHAERLEKLWNQRCQKDTNEQEESAHRNSLKGAILASSATTTRKEFRSLVNEGFLLLEEKKVSRGMETLKRAAQMSVANAPLYTFIGEHYFRSGDTKLAREYLSRAHEVEPDNVHIKLLLGLTCADDGDVGLAKRLLKEATERGGSSFSGHCGLGWLFATERKWMQALNEFKQALDTRPSPEAHYVLGAFYYQQREDLLALGHLQKAVEMDSNYHEAFYLLGLVYQRNGNADLADEAFARAASEKPSSASGNRATRKVPMLFPNTGRSQKLMTGNHKRLAAVLRDDALRVFSRPTD